jgi:ketosteroid isomerase-like protein
MKKSFILLFTLSSIIFSCGQKVNKDKLKEELLQTDREFSERSEEVGNHQAFLEYAAPDAVLLMQNQLPIVGKREIKEHFNTQNDTAYTLTWKPSYARIAKAGDMGYTYGIYTLKELNEEGTIHQGTYVTIWEKNKKGKWRFLLDSGNSGLGN